MLPALVAGHGIAMLPEFALGRDLKPGDWPGSIECAARRSHFAVSGASFVAGFGAHRHFSICHRAPCL